MRCSVTKRIAALFLCVMLLLSTLPTAAFAIKGTDTNLQSTDAITSTVSNNLSKGSNIDGTSYRVTSVKNYSIAPDISESVIITNNDAGNSQTVANVMQVNPNEGRAKIVAGYGNRNPKELGWTLKTTTEQAHVYERETGLNVVGGVNASWFNINTGEPSGYLVMNGVVHHDNSSRAFLAAFDDGSVNVFREGTTLAQAEASQSEKQGKAVQIVEAVDALVAMVWDGKVVASQSGNGGYYPRTSVGVKADGTVVLFQADGTMAPRSVGYTAEEEARMMVALGCVAAIQLDEGGSSTYLSQREGESDLTMRNTPAGGSERVVSGTILVVSTVAASGEFDHAAVTPDGEYYTPNSTVELTASAMDFSGAPAKALPADAVFTVSDAAMGTVSETTVNGSGASAVFTSSGKTGDVTIDLISGGKTVGSTILHVQEPDALSFASSEVNLNYNDVSDLGFRATYQSEQVHLKDGDINWAISDPDAGSFANNRFAVTSNVKYSGSPTVTATRGDLSATVTVNIGMEPTMILDGGDEDPWDYSTIGTTVESFGGMASNAVATYHYAGRGGVVKGSIVSDTAEEYADIVRFGHKAIKLEYDWTGLTGTDGACLGLGDNLAIDGTPTALGVWVYIPEGVPVPWLRAQIATSTNNGQSWTNAYVNFSNGSAGSGEGLKTGWQYLEADLTQYAGALIRANSGMLFRAMVTTGGIGWYTTDGVKLDKGDLKGYILLDNFCVVYGANNQDVTAPVVTSIQLVNDDGTKTELEDGMTLHSDKLRFFVTYHDSEETDPYATGVESAYFYFDGTYRGKYDCDILGSTSGLMHFGNGLHSITFYLKDGYGNVTRETRYFTVEAEKPDVPNIALNTLGVPTVGKTWQLALESDDPASITSLTATISVTRSYPVTNATFPEGVTGSWSYDPSKGVVSVEITAIDHAKYTAGALATVDIPIPTSVTEGSSINVQVTKGSYGCKQTENLDISDLNQYATGFTTPVANYPIEAMYRITAETAVAGSKATATVTVVRDGAAAVGVNVYANDVLQGQTDENGRIDISGLTASEGSVNLRAEDAEGNCSYQITLFSYNAVGDETGAPYNIIYALSPAADGKTITWMSDPRHSAAAAVAELSTSADLSEATQIEGTSRLISYSGSKQINRVNGVTLSGLTAGATYYYRVGDGTVWSEIRSFTVPAAGKQTRFFLLADIQEEAALEGMVRIADHLAGQYPFGVQLGDAVDNVRYYNQWDDALKLFTLDGIRDTDVLHVIGNHEADDSGNGAIAVKSVFGVPADWYSVERGDVYIAVLNHTSDKDTLQQFAQWLIEDAAKTSCTWKVLVTHVPAYYTNPTGGGEIYQQYLPAACDAAGIDFYFSGNDHSYARTAPLTAGQVDEKGTVYYICGSTGGKSYSIVDNKDFHFEKATLDFESIYVDVTADRFQATVTAYNVAEDGSKTVLDQYSKRKTPLCENDEHTYDYDSETDMLSCEVCGYETGAKESAYPGWAKDMKTGRMRYFAGGNSVTGVLVLTEGTYSFDQDGLTYQGEYVICGETCQFENGQFVRCTTADLINAGLCGQTANYVLYRDGKLVVGGYGDMVDNIAKRAPWGNYRYYIKHILIGNEITAIGKFNFFQCSRLESVSFAENIKLARIGWGAFGYSSLPSITIPDSVTQIDGYAFYYCSKLSSVEISENSKLARMGESVFKADAKLKYLYIPDGTNNIGWGIFEGAGNNVTVSVAANSYAQAYAEKYGISYETRTPKPTVVASGSCGDNAAWTLNSEGVLSVTGNGPMSDNNTNHAPWEAYKYQIRQVVIGKDITYIGKFNFFRCSRLETVTFEEGTKLERIGWGAFGYSSLPAITIPDSVNRIDGYAFYYCSKLTGVAISENSKLESLGEYAFKADTKMTSLYIPDGVTKIGSAIFKDVTGVTLSVAENSYAQAYAEKYGIAYETRKAKLTVVASGTCGENAAWTLDSEGVLNITGDGPMADNNTNQAPWEAYKYQIKQIVIGKDITYIGKFNFFRCSRLETVTFEEGSKLERIGWGAFGYSSLPAITIPDSVTQIDGYAFYYCSKLSNVEISENSKLTRMGEYVFKADTSLTSLYIPDCTVQIGAGLFQDAIANVTLYVAENSYAQSYAKKYGIAYETRKAKLTVVASGTCGENAAWTLDSEGVLNITGDGPMADNNTNQAPWEAYKYQIKQIVIGKGITYIGKFNFFWCNKLETVTFEEGSQLERIGWGAFGYSSLPQIAIPDSVTRLEGYAFYYCSNLSNVEISESSYLTSLGECVFKADTKLTSLYIPDGMNNIGWGIFENAIANVTLSVAESSYAQTYAEKYGIAYVTRTARPAVVASGFCGEDAAWVLTSDGVLKITGSGPMADNETNHAPWEACKYLIKQVMIGKDITYIGKFNFFWCNRLETVTFEDGSQLERIGWGAFGYSSLKTIAIPDSVTRLDGYAFYYCTKLNEVAISEGSNLESIGEYAFKGDTALLSLYIPNTVTEIEDRILQDALNIVLSVAANSYAQAYAEKLGYTYTVRGTTDAAQLETMVTELSIIPVDDELEEFQVLFLSELDDSNS